MSTKGLSLDENRKKNDYSTSVTLYQWQLEKFTLKSECCEHVFKHKSAWAEKPVTLTFSTLGPWCETNHSILRLTESRLILEKINKGQIRSKCLFWASKFPTILEVSRDKRNKQSIPTTTPKFVEQHQDISWKAICARFIDWFINHHFIYKHLLMIGTKIYRKWPVLKHVLHKMIGQNSGIWRPVLVKMMHLIFICAWINFIRWSN